MLSANVKDGASKVTVDTKVRRPGGSGDITSFIELKR